MGESLLMGETLHTPLNTTGRGWASRRAHSCPVLWCLRARQALHPSEHTAMRMHAIILASRVQGTFNPPPKQAC